MPSTGTDAFAVEFLDVSRRELREKLQRIEACVGLLTIDQVWERGHDTENAVGNLLLHLQGNVRQWIVCGIGGHPTSATVTPSLPVANGSLPSSYCHRCGPHWRKRTRSWPASRRLIS